jgi:ATP-dependent Clp protease ATP-binding subunit ClpC
VVLFDEIEKAHPRVLDLFLQIFDEGTLTDAQGRKCDFRESVIILTSNLGSGGGSAKPFIGFAVETRGERAARPLANEDHGRAARAPLEEAIAQRAQEAIRRHLRPELVNRLTKVVHFRPLEMETVREILRKLLRELNERLANVAGVEHAQGPGGVTPPARSGAGRASHLRGSHLRGVTVELDETAEELILREGFSEEFGARNLERVMDRMLGTLIAEALLSGKISAGQTIRLEANGDQIQFCLCSTP